MGRPYFDVSKTILGWLSGKEAYPLLQSLLQHRNHILALNAINVKSLGPPLQNTMVDVVLRGRVGESETQRQMGQFLILVVSLEELLKAVGDILPQLIGGAGPELIRQAVFRLGDVEATLLLRQTDFTDTQVGATHVQGQEGSLFIAIGEAHTPGNVHGLKCNQVSLFFSSGASRSAGEGYG